MSDEGDLDDVFRHLVPDELAERVLAGEIDADDLGDGLARVAGLFQAARQTATPEELGAAVTTVAAFTDAVRSNTGPPPNVRRLRVLPKKLTGKAAALVAAATLMSAGAAAAATGSLPDPIQRGVSNSLSHVGLDLPSPDAPTSAPSTPVGPDANGPAHDGLCTAYAASSGSSGKNLDSPAFTNLANAAADAGQSIEDFCAPTTTTAVTEASTEATEAATDASTEDSTPVGPDVTGPAKDGLCTAYSVDKNMDAIAFKNLSDAALAANQTIEEFCADATHKPADPGIQGQDQGNGPPASTPVSGPPASHDHP